ncbi:MAG: hypothetical protein BWK79_03590 [Beggiatoa sp. IS2]|nr:MAG: hypothetical protein BWK79_03590 [Beggiatoa sp. IS2]
MRNHLFSLLLTVSSLSLIACSSDSKPTVVLDTRPLAVKVSNGLVIEQVDVQVSDSFPIQVEVLVSGKLADDCKMPAHEIEESAGRVFTVNLIASTTTPTVANCRPENTAFTQRIPLAVDGLSAGVYTVNVDSIVKNFELAVDNVVRW